jgi:hypothetical protein
MEGTSPYSRLVKHLLTTPQGMEELIKQAFLHVDVIGPHVHEGHYDLVGPDGEIILPQVWETMIQPDWLITMHMWPMPETPPPPPEPKHHNMMDMNHMFPPPPPDGAHFLAHHLPLKKKTTKDKVKQKGVNHGHVVNVPPPPGHHGGGGMMAPPPPPPPPPGAGGQHGHAHMGPPPPPPAVVVMPGGSKPSRKKSAPPPFFRWAAGPSKTKKK